MSARPQPPVQVDASWPLQLDVPSPCIDLCRLDPQERACEGCLRTVEEIAGWPAYGRAERLEVWARLRERRAGSGR